MGSLPDLLEHKSSELSKTLMKHKDLEKEVKKLKNEQVELLTGEENMVLKSKYQALEEEKDKREEQLEDEQFKLRYQLDFR